MKWLILLFASQAWAQVPQVEALFDNQSMVIGTLIPFKANYPVQTVELSGADKDKCKQIKDPYNSSIVHLKCSEKVSDVYLRVTVLAGAQAKIVNYGPIEVKPVSPNLVVIDPTPPLDMTKYNIGRALFVGYCTGCHHSNAITPTDIRTYSKTYIRDTIIIGNKLNMGTTHNAKQDLAAGKLDLDKMYYYISNAKD